MLEEEDELPKYKSPIEWESSDDDEEQSEQSDGSSQKEPKFTKKRDKKALEKPVVQDEDYWINLRKNIGL